MKRKYSDVGLPVPPEVRGLLQEVQRSVQELEVKVRTFWIYGCHAEAGGNMEDALVSQVAEAVDRAGPAYRLDAELSEIQAGLRSVQLKLERRSSTVAQAEDTQKVKHAFKV